MVAKNRSEICRYEPASSRSKSKGNPTKFSASRNHGEDKYLPDVKRSDPVAEKDLIEQSRSRSASPPKNEKKKQPRSESRDHKARSKSPSKRESRSKSRTKSSSHSRGKSRGNQKAPTKKTSEPRALATGQKSNKMRQRSQSKNKKQSENNDSRDPIPTLRGRSRSPAKKGSGPGFLIISKEHPSTPLDKVLYENSDSRQPAVTKGPRKSASQGRDRSKSQPRTRKPLKTISEGKEANESRESEFTPSSVNNDCLRDTSNPTPATPGTEAAGGKRHFRVARSSGKPDPPASTGVENNFIKTLYENVKGIQSRNLTLPTAGLSEAMPSTEAIECEFKRRTEIPEYRHVVQEIPVPVRRSVSSRRKKSPRRRWSRGGPPQQQETKKSLRSKNDSFVIVTSKKEVHSIPNMRNHAIVVACQQL